MYLCDLVLHVFLFVEVLTVDTESEGILSQDEVDRQNKELLEQPAAAAAAQEPEIQPEPEPAAPSANKAVESGTKCFGLV